MIMLTGTDLNLNIYSKFIKITVALIKCLNIHIRIKKEITTFASENSEETTCQSV